jgi:molybdate transport system ATP-binding protein
MDEPLGSIDTESRYRILPYLQRLHTTLGIPFIYVSHSMDEVLYLADQVFVLGAGRVTQSGSVVEFSVDGPGITQPDAATIIRCQVTNQDTANQLTEVSFENQVLYIAADKYVAGDAISVRIPARDVSIALEKPVSSSILNILSTRISEIHDPGNGPTVVIRLSCGEQQLLARITRKSLTELNLSPGERVFAQIKGVALMTDYERNL